MALLRKYNRYSSGVGGSSRSGEHTYGNVSSQFIVSGDDLNIDALSFESRVVAAAQVSLWDNVVGPRVAHIWTGCKSLKMETRTAVGRYALMEELDRIDILKVPEAKFNILPDWGVLSCSAIFSGKMDKSVTGYAISVLLGKEHLERFLSVQHLVEDRLILLASFLMSTLDLGWFKAISRFNYPLGSFLADLEIWFNSSLEVFTFESTLFASVVADQQEKEFIAKAITSHIQNGCVSVVIGESLEDVNSFIHTLALFTPERMRDVCSLADPKKYARFVPGLRLQGLVVERSASRDDDFWKLVTEEDLLDSPWPVSIVNLLVKKVKSCRYIHEFHAMKMEELAEMRRKSSEDIQDDSLNDASLLFGDSTLLGFVRGSSPLIAKIVDLASSVPQYIRGGYIKRSFKVLLHRAMELVFHVWDTKKVYPLEKEGSAVGRLDMDKILVSQSNTEIPSGRRNGTGLGQDVIRRLRNSLALSDEEDFLLLLSLSEVLEPGIYEEVLGNPSAIGDRIVCLFNAL